MNRFLKWAGIVFSALVVVYFKSQKRLTRIYDVPDEMVSIPADSTSVERGGDIFKFRGSEARHSEGGYLHTLDPNQSPVAHLNPSAQDVPLREENVYLDDPPLGKVIATNLTSGKGGVGGSYTDRDWVRVIRHGIRPGSTLSATGRAVMTLVPGITFIPAELIPQKAPRPVGQKYPI